MNQFSREIKWIKKNYKSILFWGVIIFLLIPQVIFIIVEDGEHLGFLGGYVGAILTLGGVWFQIYKLEQHRKNDEEKRERERKEGVLKYLQFVLEENIEGAKENDCAYIMQANLLYLTSWKSYKEESEMFTKFKNQFIDNNLNVIMEFEENIGEDVLKIERLILNTLKNYNYLLKNKERRKVLFESLKVIEKLKEKDRGILDKIRCEPRKITWDKSVKEMEELMEDIRGELLPTRWGKKSEEMWKYHLLDKNLNGKGFEIIEKSEKLLEKIENELKNIEKNKV